MRSKKSKKRGGKTAEIPSSRTTSPSTPTSATRIGGRREIPINHSLTTSQVSENHNQSESPDHSHASLQDSSDPELVLMQDQASASRLNLKTIQSHDGGALIQSNLSTIAGSLQPIDGVDKPRKLSKRERKALIRSNKKTRAVVDESFVANMEELSEMFQTYCKIASYQQRPVAIASDPSDPESPQSPSKSIVRGRSGRRGVHPTRPPKHLVASWSPLCLPRRGLPDKPKSPSSCLQRLTPRCVRHFLKAADNLLLPPSSITSRLFRQVPILSQGPLVCRTNALRPPHSGCVNNNNNNNNTDDEDYQQYRTAPPAPPGTTSPYSSCGSGVAIFAETPPNTHKSQPPPLPPASSSLSSSSTTIKRGRGRPPKTALGGVLASSMETPIIRSLALDGLTAQHAATQSPCLTTISSTYSKARRPSVGTPRELRGLVTWDAMMKAAQDTASSSRLTSEAATHGTPLQMTTTTIPAALSPLSLQIVSGGLDDAGDQRTTRGRSRRLSTGPASSGSFTTATTSATVATAASEAESCSTQTASQVDPSKSTGLQSHHMNFPRASPSPTPPEMAGSASDVGAVDKSLEGVDLFSSVSASPSRSSVSSGSCFIKESNDGSSRKRKSASSSLSLLTSSQSPSFEAKSLVVSSTPPPPPPAVSSPLLPPRKRYKIVGEASSLLTAPSTVSSNVAASAAVGYPGQSTATQLLSDALLSPLTPRVQAKRPRGRPSKRGGLSRPLETSLSTIRPKREAAVLGFASMIASSSSTTNSSPMHRSTSSSPSSSPPGGVDATPSFSSSSTPFTVDAVEGMPQKGVHSAKRGRKPKKSHPTSRSPIGEDIKSPSKPRGRPPKIPRPPPTAVMAAGNAVKEATPFPATPPTDVRVPEVKRPLQMATDIFIELHPPCTLNLEAISGVKEEVEEVTPPPSLLLLKNKRGRRATSTLDTISQPTPAKRKPFVEDEEECSGETASVTKAWSEPKTSNDDLDLHRRLHYESHQLRLFLLRTHSKGGRRKHPDCCSRYTDVGLTTTQDLLSSGSIAQLPSRCGFFPFASLTQPVFDPIKISSRSYSSNGDDDDSEQQEAVRQMFFRLLDTPDVLVDASTRLAAPLLSLPCPLRQPDFYRYICVSGLLSNFEQAVESAGCGGSGGGGASLESRILRTVSPQVVSEAARSLVPPFSPPDGDAEWPPLCLRSLLPCLNEGGFQRLDLLMEFLLRTWEAYAGRRSWLGKNLQQIRALYSQLRAEYVVNHPGKSVPPPSVGLTSGSSKGSGPIIAGSGAARKKVDRQTLERGAEVIRCLCGFRVEGGHVMVQCSACITRQHLPCIWWALCLDLNPRLAAPATTQGSKWPGVSPSHGGKQQRSTERLARCRAVLVSALAAGGHDVARLLPASGWTPSSTTTPTALGLKSSIDTPYFCPRCLEIDGLTKDYPRTLAVSLAVHSAAAVLPTEAPSHDYWSLGTLREQFLTDEFAIIHRHDYEQVTQGARLTRHDLDPRQPIARASDAIIVRIYRLWKDFNGESYMEGGAFLRPYDLPPAVQSSTDMRWHTRELVYDEASRLVLPLMALRGHCSVLSPSVYRLGRPADLPAVIRAADQRGGYEHSDRAETEETDTPHPLVFLCERLVTRNADGGELHFQDIAPAYLKVTMKPYYFLRHCESSGLRAAVVRASLPEDLLRLDADTPLGEIMSSGVEEGSLFCRFRQRRWPDTDHLSTASEEKIQPHPPKEEPCAADHRDQTPIKDDDEKPQRRLDVVLSRLKTLPPPLSTTTTEQTTHFPHGSRKPRIVQTASTTSSYLSAVTGSSGLLIKRCGRNCIGPVSDQPPITTLTFSELQQQIAQGDDSLTKDSTPSTSPLKRRGRKPKPALTSLDALEMNFEEEEEEEEEEEVPSPSSPQFAETSFLEIALSHCDASFKPVIEDALTATVFPETPRTVEVLHEASEEMEPSLNLVSAVDLEVADFGLSVSCTLEESETQPSPLVNGTPIICALPSVRLAEDTGDTDVRLVVMLPPSISEIVQSLRTPRILYAEVGLATPPESPTPLDDDDLGQPALEYLELGSLNMEVSEDVLQSPPTSFSCDVKEATCGVHFKQQLHDDYQPISSSSSEGSVNDDDDDVERRHPPKATWDRVSSDVDEHEDDTNGQRRSSNCSSSRRRKGSSPKKRVFEDPERGVLDLSAKFSTDE